MDFGAAAGAEVTEEEPETLGAEDAEVTGAEVTEVTGAPLESGGAVVCAVAGSFVVSAGGSFLIHVPLTHEPPLVSFRNGFGPAHGVYVGCASVERVGVRDCVDVVWLFCCAARPVRVDEPGISIPTVRPWPDPPVPPLNPVT